MKNSVDISAQRQAEFLAHPRFAEARRAYIDGYLGLYSGDPVLNKLLAEVSRHLIATFVVCLAAGQRDDDPETWLTLTKLQDVVGAFQAGSPGLVENIVNRMQDRGLLQSTPAPADRRKKILSPTPALLAHDRDLIAIQALPCAMVWPSPALDSAIARDPGMQVTVRAMSVELFAEAMVFLSSHREMMSFMMRDSGLMILFAMVQNALAANGGTQSTLSYQDMADRFGVSRTHVRDLVADAEAMGLVTIVKSGGAAVDLTAELWRLLDRWTAAASEFFDRTCVAAHARLLISMERAPALHGR
jgi:DNA-binding MarR family transcriptional regulator